MAGCNQIVIDGLGRAGSLARPDVTFETRFGPGVQVLRVNETWCIAAKASLVMGMKPLVGWAVAGFALDAESVMGSIR